ncbi:MAG: hypothetical protein ABIP90_00705 [Vicinamibacterales bacterium]
MSITVLSRLPRVLSFASLSAVVMLAGCEQAKTATPLSPLIAGPIEGVNITLPKPLEPATGWKVEDKNQPITLLIENPSSTSPRPYTMRVQLATNASFANVIFASSGLAPGPNGRTSLRLPDKLAAGQYLWRAQAEDGANTSEWSAAAQFEVLQPIVIGTPVPREPLGNVRVTTRLPTLVATNGNSAGPHGALFYLFQLSNSDSFGALTGNAESPQHGSGQTSYTIPSNLPYDTVLYWRVRITDGLNTGPWSRTETFRTPVAPVVVPPPPPPPGGGSGGGSGSCASNNGDAIINCISAKYPERLVPTGTVGQRQDNMMFLRDRIIEAGKCGGLDLGWNLKRGGPEISIDFLTWRDNGVLRGMDLAYDYDNNNTTLRLTWAEGTFPFYKAYPSVNCG